MYVLNTTRIEKLCTTWFHESGHGLDANGGDDGYFFGANGVIFQYMIKDASDLIQITIDEFLLGKTLPKDEREKIVKSIIGSSQGFPEWNEDAQTWEIVPVVIENVVTKYVYQQVASWINALSLEEKQDGNNSDAYMGTDCLNGLTENLVFESDSFTAGIYMMVHGTLGKEYGHPADYWYSDSGQPSMQCLEAWAEFFAAKMTRNEDAIRSNQLYFPETCAYLDELAKDMLNYYKDKAGAK